MSDTHDVPPAVLYLARQLTDPKPMRGDSLGAG